MQNLKTQWFGIRNTIRPFNKLITYNPLKVSIFFSGFFCASFPTPHLVLTSIFCNFVALIN